MKRIATDHKIAPKHSVDDVTYGMNAETLTSLGYAEDVEAFNKWNNWRTFAKTPSLDVYVEDGLVVCIACFDRCEINGFALLGTTPDEFISILGPPDEIGDPAWIADDSEQTPYEYENLGLQVWVELGKAVSVFCDGYDYSDD